MLNAGWEGLSSLHFSIPNSTFCIPPKAGLRSAGLEPATPWFEARYSIQLSYGRDILRLAVMGRRS